MHEFKKFGKKLFTMSVVGMTMVWSVGLSAFVPAGVAAASCPELVAGDLFKVPTIKNSKGEVQSGTNAVYLATSDLKRLVFSKSEIFESWYGSFANVVVKEIPASCIDAYDVAGGVNFRPGSTLVKSVLSPTVWAIAPGNMKIKVSDGAVLTATYGPTWGKQVWDLPDSFMAYLSTQAGGDLMGLHNGMLVKKATDATVYYMWDGKLKKVEGTLPAHVAKNVHAVSDATFAAVSMDSMTVTPATVTANPSQRAAGGVVVVPPATGGSLTVSLAADTPVQPAGGLADGTANNKMLKVSVRASSKDVKVTGLTITRTGLVANTSITGVSVWDSKGYRKGDVMTSFNSDNRITVGFASNPVLVAAGTTEVLTVSYNLASTATSGSVGATLASKADVMTDATAVEGTFPIVGNLMSIVDGGSSLSAYTVTTTAVGGISAATVALATAGTANVSVGDVKEVAKVKFTETSGLNDLSVSGAIFFLEGTVKDKDFTNFEVLGHDNAVLGKADYAGNRYVTVMFDKAYVVPKSQNRTVTLRAKVADGSGNVVRFLIQNDSDVFVTDKALGYQILPTSFIGGGAGVADGWFKVKEGTVTISKAQTSKSGNVSAGASLVELAKFDVTASGEDLQIQKIGVGIVTSGPIMPMPLTGNLTLVAENGDTLAQFSASSVSDDLYAAAGSQRSLSQYWTIPSGKTMTLRVLGDIQTNATSTGYTVKIGNFYAKRLSSLNFANNLPSSSNVGTAANTVTVQSTNLTVSKDTTMGNRNIAAGSKAIVLAQFVAQAGSSEAIRLTNVSLTNGGTAGAADGLRNLEVWMGTTTAGMEKMGLTISPAATSSNSYAFDKLIPANETQIVQVRGDVDSNATTGGTFIISLGDGTGTAYSYIGKLNGNSTVVTAAVTGQTMTVQAANLIISATSDETTISKVRTPSTAPVQLGKWKIQAQNEDVTLNKITFNVSRPDTSSKTDAAEFGTMYLYDAANMTTPLDDATYIPGSGNGYVRFEKTNMLAVANNATKYLVLMGQVNGSGTMNPATTTAFFIGATTTANFEATRSSGGVIDNNSTMLDFGASGQGYVANHATSTFYLFHNSAPVFAKQSLGTALTNDTVVPIFKFTVTNPGTVEMRLSTTTINVSAAGMLANGSSGTGTIHSFALWQADSTTGALVSQIATSSLLHNTNSAGGLVASACLAGSSILMTAADAAGTCVNAPTSSINLVFGQFSDLNSLFDNLTISAGGSKTFVLVANTFSAFLGKTASNSATVSVKAKLDGGTNFSVGNATHEPDWADGVMLYYYTPDNGGSENTTAYSASDYYDVEGDSMSKTL